MADGTILKKRHLSRAKHPQMDLFIADVFDASASVKDDQASMEHPFFALKPGDHRTVEYRYGDKHISVECGSKGRATIHDKDIWIYCISHLMHSLNEGNPISRRVDFVAYDFLVTTNRAISGATYKGLADALQRLTQTSVVTNIETGGKKSREIVHLLDSAYIERDDRERMTSITVTLPDWLMNSIIMREVLTISRDYFRIRKPLDRRIYELVRKHCGKQLEWRIGLDKLHLKTGSTASLKEFRRAVKSLAASDDLPQYRIVYNAELDQVLFYQRSTKGALKQLRQGRILATSLPGGLRVLIGYARVSTDDQNLDLQRDALESAGCEKIYTDTISGRATERAGLDAALDFLRAGDTLVVWKLDRLGRSVKQLVDLVQDLEDREIQFKSLSDSIDTQTPAGRFFFHVMASLAQMERELIAERTKAGLAAARARGRHPGRKRVMTDQKLKTAKKLVADGELSMREIADSLGVSLATLYRWRSRDFSL
ncbi:unnamed protein product [Cyprideis torosa]|uniref:Uncharacterized protein n=1 Tax=Cyprideis torosa TaxID=163714 RepID=A0A7R8WPH1_9CRUS|nr:unnamed protein product [Cyprideis torosa]CAG0901290.1 unnamed protein product [Cyprideis torosa]